MNQENTSSSLYEPEFSFKQIIKSWLNSLKYVFSFKKQLGLAVLTGLLLGAALAWKRSVASRPTTPNEVRWLTATRYAKIPMIQISQARGEVTPPLCPRKEK